MNRKNTILAVISLLTLLAAGCTSSQVTGVSEVNDKGEYYATVNKQTHFLYWSVMSAGVMKCTKGSGCKEIPRSEQ